jgi:integrase/recombinase XerD
MLAMTSVKSHSVARLVDHSQAERLRRRAGLMIKRLVFTGARVQEFVQLRVVDVQLDSDLPHIRIRHAKRQSDRHVPMLPTLAQGLWTHGGADSTGRCLKAIGMTTTRFAACTRW